MGTMQIQDAFAPYYEAASHPGRPDKTWHARQEAQGLAEKGRNQQDPSADVVARLTRCRDSLARALSKRRAGH